MKFDLNWRYKHKVGEIDITSDFIIDLLKLTEYGEPLCLVPQIVEYYYPEIHKKESEIKSLSLIPLRNHPNSGR